MVTQTVTEVLENHVTLDLEGIDRLYLNAYQPMLQSGGGIVHFFKKARGAKVASSVLMAPISRDFVQSIRDFAEHHGIDQVRFKKGERKDDITQSRLKAFKKKEGVLYIGVAQEKTSTFRTVKKVDPESHRSFPWLSRSTVLCNQYYFYLVDEDFGPMFIKFSSYFPYTARINLNGHEYVKRQLDKKGIAFEALDNGILKCDQPAAVQRLMSGLSAHKIERVVRKWFKRLPHPFTASDQRQGFCYDLSILQAEFARTQVFDRPRSGRLFFEEVIRDNIDLGRPEQVSLIFDRRITSRTPGTFRTRVLTHGVTPSLHVSYKHSKIKQYFKESKALRTETTINNTRDFGIGKRLKNLSELRKIGLTANRRLLDVQKISQDCQIGEECFQKLSLPQIIDDQRVAALKFGDPRVMALLLSLCQFMNQLDGFSNASLRRQVAELMGEDPAQYSQGRMTYDLRRLRLHGLIKRIPRTHRYQVTSEGLRISLWYTKVHGRVLRGGLSQLFDNFKNSQERPLVWVFNKLERVIDDEIAQAKIAA